MRMNWLAEKPEWSAPMEFPTLHGTIALDLETKDPWLKSHGPGWPFAKRGTGHHGWIANGGIVGASVATGDGFVGYYPIRHEGGGNLDEGMVLRWLKAQLANPALEVVFANCTYDLGWLRAHGIEVAGKLHDVQIQAPLLDEYRTSYSLDALAKDYIGQRKDKSLRQALADHGLKDAGDLWRMAAPFAGPYAEQDARITLELHNVLKAKVEADGLQQVYALETALVPVLLAMRERGVRVNVRRAEILRQELRAKEQDALALIKHQTGLRVDQWAAASVSQALEYIGVTVPKTEHGAPSVTKALLHGIDHPVAKAILDSRKYQKARSTFVEAFILNHAIEGRIHCQFNALRSDEGGTVSGRLSSSGPNLQQLPARDDEIGPMIRSLFLPEDGDLWAANDYSSQEPRLTVHFAELSGVRGGAEAGQAYRDNPRLDLHQMVADLCGIKRKDAKTINLGLAYGMGGAKLCVSLGLPTEKVERYGKTIEIAGEEGQRLLDLYKEKSPFIGELNDQCKNVVQHRARIDGVGSLKTLLGRKCRFPMKNGQVWYAHKALNRLIQGSAADQTKAAMIALHKAGYTQLVTVHDELGLSVKSREEAEAAARIMEETTPLKVPSIVDVEIGPSWGEAK